jgi:hypothetical protein
LLRYGTIRLHPVHNHEKRKGLSGLYDKFATMLANFRTNKGLSAAVYIEITDVEIELNGLMTYDRVLKADPQKIRQSNLKAIFEDVKDSVK